MSQKKYDVRLARRADRMLLSHTIFLSQVSSIAARKLLSAFKKSTDRMADNPFQFPFADESDISGIPPEKYRKCLIDDRYKALFIVDENIVYIDAIIDCRQENTSLY